MATSTNIQLDEFLSITLAKLIEAERAIHDGDVAPRLQMWSMNDPVTLFGAWGPCNSGWDEVSRTFRWVASRFFSAAASTGSSSSRQASAGASRTPSDTNTA
jgi:hypothetical protein